MSGDDGRAAVAETHVSVLVFVGDRAYKLKKPVAMGFLDFSTREAREAACRREVELNRPPGARRVPRGGRRARAGRPRL